jgi:hypothetical protein
LPKKAFGLIFSLINNNKEHLLWQGDFAKG